MLSIVPYITKVVIISGFMYGYYWIALRNKKFHQFNRFYLLSAVILPLVLPLVNLQFLFPAGNRAIPVAFSHDIIMDNIVIYANSGSFWSTENILNVSYLLIAAILLTVLLISIIRIIRLNKKGKATRTQGIILVNIKTKGTPFSFFNRVFWNPDVDLRSTDGIKILNHELIHCRQWHSIDKVFIRIVCSIFWFNPFFWMIKNEVYLVHEFLADKISFEKDGAAFSKIILEGIYPGYNWSVTNNFFYSPIKRRIIMLLKNNHKKVSYLGRLLVLPLMAVLFSLFATKAKAVAETLYENITPRDTTPKGNVTKNDAYFQGEETVTIKNAKQNNEIVTKGQITIQGLKVPPPTDQSKLKKDTVPPSSSSASPNNSDNSQLAQILPDDPLYILNGKKINKLDIETLRPDKIKSIKVLKDANATAKYGPEGRNGVIEIYTKHANQETSISQKPLQLMAPITDTVPKESEKIFTKTEIEAQFPGGIEAWRKHITQFMIKHLDSFTQKDYGTVIIRFIVDKDGTVHDVVATNMKNTELAKVAIKAIREGPNWIPAQQYGRYVNAYRLQPVTLANPNTK